LLSPLTAIGATATLLNAKQWPDADLLRIHCRKPGLSSGRARVAAASWRFHSNRPDIELGHRYNDPSEALEKVMSNAYDHGEAVAIRLLEIADHVRSHRRAINRAI
jgi:hypothetical protein